MPDLSEQFAFDVFLSHSSKDRDVVRDIAERLGIRQASLYYYFPSKEAALSAICELGVKGFIANLERIIAEPAPAFKAGS